jgi:predicted MFS family arabinose efflux permease
MWLWRLPFLRTGSLLYAGANVTFTAAQLLVVLIARRHGASSASIGLAFAVVGAAGLVGATLAGPLRRRLSPRWAILTEAWIAVLCFPLLLVAHSPLSIGLVLGATVLPMAVSTSVLVSHRLTLAPDYLRGRVQASGAFIAMSVAWIGPLVIGVLFQAAGESIAVLVITGWALLVATGGTLAPGLRHLPTPDEAAAAAVAAARSAS